MKHVPITIGIITKNRTQQLSICIDSIQNQQLFRTDQLIIIDNSTDTSTINLIQKKLNTIKIPLILIREPLSNLSRLRNHVLQKATNKWVVFIDDDCIAHYNWISEIQRSIRMHPHAAVIVGASYAARHDNVYSITTEINELYWKIKSRIGNRIMNFESIDNKNTICNMDFLSHNRILYDQNLRLFYGFGEDLDFGRQIQQAGGKGYYNKSLIIYHENLRTFLLYFRRLFIRLSGNYGYEIKWYTTKHKIVNHSHGKISFLRSYFTSHDCSIMVKLQIFWLLGATFIFIRLVKMLMRYYYCLHHEQRE